LLLAVVLAAVAILRPGFARAIAGPDEEGPAAPVPAQAPQAPAEIDLVGAEACSCGPEK